MSKRARFIPTSRLRRFSTAVRRRVEDDVELCYSPELRVNESFGRIGFPSISHIRNDVVSAIDSPPSGPEYNNSFNKGAQEINTDCELVEHFGVLGYQWRTPCFNDNSHQNTVKVMAAYRDLNPGEASFMQQANCLGVPSESRSIAMLTSNLKLLNSKITTHMQNGLVEEAQKLFNEMPERNTVTWNAMIRGYFQNGLSHHALHLYEQMRDRDLFSYNTVIAGLMKCGDVNAAKDIFYSMPFRDIVTWNSMISGYIQNGSMDEAMWMFDRMPSKNVVSWNLVIGGLLNHGEFDVAEKMFNEMGARDIVSWTIMMSGLVRAGRIVEARELFDGMPVRDVQAWNTIIAGYIDSRYLNTAEVLFQKMPNRNLNSWSGLITGLVNGQRINDAMRLFNEMPEKCRKLWNSILMGLTNNGFVEEAHAVLEKSPFNDVVSRTIMIIGYFDIGEGHSAIKLFKLMPTRDTTAWNATIFGLIVIDRFEDGLKLFMQMKEFGFPMDEATITSALTICSNLPTLNLGRQTHAQVITMGFDCLNAVCNALVTMYARCGNMHSALLQFSSMSRHDVISWNSIISGFAHHGHGEGALNMFNEMRLADVKPNHITFTTVLSACSHAGLVQQGKYYFDFMRYKCFLQPMAEHYTCIIDLLGRFGLIDEALKFLEQMKLDGIEISASVWGALLGACRLHKNIDLGEIAGERVLELEPQNSGFYMILAEMYLENGRKKDAERMWTRMKANVVKKQPGCSWIEVNNTGHVFLSGNSSHPYFSSICCILDLLLIDMGFDVLTPNSISLERR